MSFYRHIVPLLLGPILISSCSKYSRPAPLVGCQGFSGADGSLPVKEDSGIPARLIGATWSTTHYHESYNFELGPADDENVDYKATLHAAQDIPDGVLVLLATRKRTGEIVVDTVLDPTVRIHAEALYPIHKRSYYSRRGKEEDAGDKAEYIDCPAYIRVTRPTHPIAKDIPLPPYPVNLPTPALSAETRPPIDTAGKPEVRGAYAKDPTVATLLRLSLPSPASIAHWTSDSGLALTQIVDANGAHALSPLDPAPLERLILARNPNLPAVFACGFLINETYPAISQTLARNFLFPEDLIRRALASQGDSTTRNLLRRQLADPRLVATLAGTDRFRQPVDCGQYTPLPHPR